MGNDLGERLNPPVKRKRATREPVVGEHLIHRHLWEGARFLQAMATDDMPGRSYPLLAATLFLYFAFEASSTTSGTSSRLRRGKMNATL